MCFTLSFETVARDHKLQQSDDVMSQPPHAREPTIIIIFSDDGIDGITYIFLYVLTPQNKHYL